jgi:hypothetical protein
MKKIIESGIKSLLYAAAFVTTVSTLVSGGVAPW